MYLSRITIENFRNFHSFNVPLAGSIVIVGENRAGKSNLLHALRLLLDPSLPDSSRQLTMSDFWDGLDGPSKDDKITVTIEVSDFERDLDVLALLTDYRSADDPTIAKLTYEFRPKPDLDHEPDSDEDYEFICYGGEDEANEIRHDLRRRIALDVLPALRDAEGDLSSWRRSPLRPLIDAAMSGVEIDELEKIGAAIEAVAAEITKFKEVRDLEKEIAGLFQKLSGPRHDVKPRLGLSPTDATRLHRNVRLLIDEGLRGIGDASLGSANLIFLTLKALEIQRLIASNQRDHTFLAIEEPEAHLHPHLQRLVYRHFFGLVQKGDDQDAPLSAMLTTHSPHIASVAPLTSILLLKNTDDGTVGASTATLSLSEDELDDLTRYLDVTRAEMLFARGVILVEGDAERFLVPLFAEVMNKPLDQVGITVCSVGGTNFKPYVTFLTMLGIPFSVLTDWDPTAGRPLGANRIGGLVTAILDGLDQDVPKEIMKALKSDDYSQIISLGAKHNVFTNEHTFEIDLFRGGFQTEIIAVLEEEDFGPDRAKWISEWKKKPANIDNAKYLSLIEAIGKGRFAQRLASRIKGAKPPAYIKGAIESIYERV